MPSLSPRSSLEWRRAIRAGEHKGLTSGLAPGHLQANLAVVPARYARDFVAFCDANPASLPILAVGQPGDPRLPGLGDDLDVRTDLPAYRVYRDGRFAETRQDIRDFWSRDMVAVAIGCWFSVEEALAAAGVRLKHVELGIQGSLFRTNVPAREAGPFGGTIVVSMRPFAERDVPTVEAITFRHTKAHGAPLHKGDPAPLGIRDIARPDFGEPIPIDAGEVPLYWGCGLTALAALERAGLPLFITHAPGAMLITDLRNEEEAPQT